MVVFYERNLYGANGAILVPIPMDGLAHQMSSFTVTGQFISYKIKWQDGNRYLEVLPDGVQTFTVSSTVALKPINVVNQAKRALWGYPANLHNYTLPDDLIDSSHPTIRQLAAEYGTGPTVRWKPSEIRSTMAAHISVTAEWLLRHPRFWRREAVTVKDVRI